MTKTFQPKEKEVARSWHLLDAKDQILGRISTQIAIFLMGKHKATYSSHMDSGDFVVVLNAEKVEVTGKKASQKSYKSHSGYPGGFKEAKYAKVMKEHPERILEHAVSGMIPDNRLKNERMSRLKIIVGDKNPFEKEFTK
jgi:large subunit ribosomal protein L13